MLAVFFRQVTCFLIERVSLTDLGLVYRPVGIIDGEDTVIGEYLDGVTVPLDAIRKRFLVNTWRQSIDIVCYIAKEPRLLCERIQDLIETLAITDVSDTITPCIIVDFKGKCPQIIQCHVLKSEVPVL